MTNASVTIAPAQSGDIASPASKRPPFAARRRLLVGASLLVLIGLAILANYGPVRDYRDARARLEERTAQVAALEAQKAELQSRLGKLSEVGYLESLARQELTYVRPGEDLFIVTAPAKEAVSPTDAVAGEADSTAGRATDRPGLLERILSAIGGLF
jgi:cell division protein FtsB